MQGTSFPRIAKEDIIDLSELPKEQLAQLKFLNLHKNQVPTDDDAEQPPQRGKGKKTK